ncbi:MAG: hypothetical protein HN353_06195 [Bdellovibrionales bacterium]|nr:hypothetical protein [Bdellovibrionales bacterium]MBT3526223.1 hypothetical protein [Bdellovibrionales bacterium]MBT7768297.1 hypothetical protein [Bdellovibrionales bacterium]
MKILNQPLILFLLLSFLLSSCSKVTDDTNPQGGDNIISGRGNLLPEGSYPHSLEFTISPDHGVAYQKNPKKCTVCHGKDLAGGKSQVSCLRCHKNVEGGVISPIKNTDFMQNYPHTLDFKVSSEHGEKYQGNKRSCQLCHGDDLQGGPTKVSCDRCHLEYATTDSLSMRHIFRQTKGYPHSFSFKIGKRHGKKYKKDPKLCQKCHGEKLDGGRSKIGCASCHLDFLTSNQFQSNTMGLIPKFYPHTLDFKISSQHGLAFGANPDKCQQCHGVKFDGGPSKVSCIKCHIGGLPTDKLIFPPVHSAEFKDKEHGKYFLHDRSKCIQCHKINPDQNIKLSSCKKCHDYPHPTFWSRPDNHGANFLTEIKSETPKNVSCINCHGESEASEVAVMSNSLPIGCDKCHLQMPHPRKFRSSRKHGRLDSKEYTSCGKCHSELFGNLPNAKPWDGESEDLKGCFNCHNNDGFPDIFTFTIQDGEFNAEWMPSTDCSMAMIPEIIGSGRMPASKCRKPKALLFKRTGQEEVQFNFLRSIRELWRP